ncbi:MAG: N-6 DNA methylase, partial [Planctomycetaceae bacterium]|nr:N-6 DNA methylase [Planctomycetaceae bacterium]
AANERRSTGAFYTPTSIIEAVLDATLDPLLDEAERSSDPEGSLLAITVCDPSCGSGHFLVAAARRIAARLADVREGRMLRSTSAPLERSTLHEVVQRCIYGVDINPMAAELARVSLFLEALEPGRPLGFLDAHIRSGNALLGATPAALARGLPDEAFKKASSDDEVVARSLAKRNAHERAGQADLFTSALPLSNTDLAAQ